MNERVGIVLSTYNNADTIHICINSILEQKYHPLTIVVADDGSSDDTVKVLQRLLENHESADVLALEHGERGIARKEAIERALSQEIDYLFFIDSDMHLDEHLVEICLEYLNRNAEVGALVVPETPYSSYDNFATRVKIFERKILNNAGTGMNGNSIEAARFWKRDAYLQSGGINPEQVSFEETQPTIRYLSAGGKIRRILKTTLFHDEKYVTFKNLFEKKRYYFGAMEKTLATETKGVASALKRWYFFRPVLYRPSNLLEYLKHPVLAGGMLYMYLSLTLIGTAALVKKRKSRLGE